MATPISTALHYANYACCRRLCPRDTGMLGAAQKLQQRRLAGAVAADDAPGFAFVNLEGHVPHRLELAIISARRLCEPRHDGLLEPVLPTVIDRVALGQVCTRIACSLSARRAEAAHDKPPARTSAAVASGGGSVTGMWGGHRRVLPAVPTPCLFGCRVSP